MFIVPNREVFFDLSEFIPYFDFTSIKHSEFNITNANEKLLIISFHKNLKFAIIGLDKEEQEELKNIIRKDFEDKEKLIIKIPRLNNRMSIKHIKS